MSGPRLADVLAAGTGTGTGTGTENGTGVPRAAVLAEYPYYRAHPSRWADNLRSLRELGADVITAYVPWRLHETLDADGTPSYDFTGRTRPHTDLAAFLRHASAAGLRVLLKPGPYIYAEVRLGGLPDRVTPGGATPYTDAAGAAVTSETRPLPSAYDPWFRAQARTWLTAVREEILLPYGPGRGPVVAVQLGNEGIYGELERATSGGDFAAPARAAASAAGVPGADAPPGTALTEAGRAAWVRWDGSGLRGLLEEIQVSLGTEFPALVNLPLPHLGEPGSAEAWVNRAAALVPSGVTPGNTSWAGAAALDDGALSALWFGMRFLRSDAVEDNWGFTWDGAGWARPLVPLQHALLGLAFGSSTVAVYTACTTRNWPADLEPDHEGLRAEGLNPVHYQAPYCPGAPLDESGELRPNARALRMIRHFLEWYGVPLIAARPTAAVRLVVDPVTLTARAWPASETAGAQDGQRGGRGPLATAVAAATALLRAGTETDVALPHDPALTEPARQQGVARSWLVAGGAAMSASLQKRLAARAADGERVVVVGRLPHVDEDGTPCALLKDVAVTTVGAGDPDLVRLAVTGAADDAGDGHRAADTGPRATSSALPPVLALSRSDEASGTHVAYLFNRTDAPASWAGRLDAADCSVELGPRETAVLVLRSGKLDGYLAAGPWGRPQGSPLVLRAGGTSIARPAHADTVARRQGDGWQTLLFSDVDAPGTGRTDAVTAAGTAPEERT